MTARAPWLSHSRPGRSPSLAPYPTRTLLDYVTDAARQHPESPAVLFKGATLDLRRARGTQRCMRRGARRPGVRRGDRIALLLPNCPQFLIVEIGAWKLGAIVAPLNPTYTESEIEGRAARARRQRRSSR
jgi:long-chain acyl-CoA synthetase